MGRIYSFVLNSENSAVDKALKDLAMILGREGDLFYIYTPDLKDMDSEIFRSFWGIAIEVDNVTSSVTGQIYDYRKDKWVDK